MKKSELKEIIKEGLSDYIKESTTTGQTVYVVTRRNEPGIYGVFTDKSDAMLVGTRLKKRLGMSGAQDDGVTINVLQLDDMEPTVRTMSK